MKQIFASAVLACSFSCAAAAPVGAVGHGVAMSCGDWLQERAEPRTRNGGRPLGEMTALIWVQGYLSGMNTGVAASDKGKLADLAGANAIAGWLDNHCKSHPLEKLNVSATKLFIELRDASVE